MIRRILDASPSGAIAIFFSIALLANVAYLFGGFSADDFLLINLLREDPLPFSRWRGLWSTDAVAAFENAWWRDADAVGTFWRPIPSLIFEGSLRLFGEAAWPLHLLSVLLHGWVAGALYLLVRRLTGDPAMAWFSGLFFVVCEDHTMGIGWIATITDLLCVALVMAALLAQVQWLRTRRVGWLVAALSAVTAALGCKESAAVAPLLLVMLGVFMPGGVDRRWTLRGSLGFVKDVASWLPPLAVFVAFLGAYKGFELGGMNNLMYIDPLGQPRAYFAHLLPHLPVMWLATLSPVPPSATMFLPGTLVPLALLGVLAFVVWIALAWELFRRSLALWAMGLYLLCLLPQLGTDASERALYLPFLGAAVLLAMAVSQLRWLRSDDGVPTGRVRIAGWAGLLGILVPGALLSFTLPYSFVPSLNAPEKHAVTAIPHIGEHEHVVMLTAASMMDTLYPHGVIAYHTGREVDLWLLSAFSGVASVERLDDRSFVLRTDRPGWLSNLFARIVRTDPVLHEGRVYERPFFTATLQEMSADARDVLGVRFEFDFDLADPRCLWLWWNGDAFEPLDLQGLPVGERHPLADASNIWAAMM
jgi:hypothetical protein